MNTPTTIDQAKDVAVRYLESHAIDLGRFVVSAVTTWIRDRHAAEAAIARARAEYLADFDAIEARMRSGA